MPQEKQIFADILLPLPLPGMFTYLVPEDMSRNIKTGIRVIVQFGSKKVYSGLVKNIHTS
ncbi:MAG: hypothetical protein GX587_08925, partial [Bacteroidales bacterium]|nr:hypothetical protein [Bacteroidales bacterium]